MSEHHAQDFRSFIRHYLIVFYALIFGTIITVAAYYLKMASVALAITTALFIATVKALLVASYFMHLISERKMIYGILAATGFFFAGLMYLTVSARDDTPRGTVNLGSGQAFHSATTNATH